MQVIRDRESWGGQQTSRWMSVQRMSGCMAMDGVQNGNGYALPMTQPSLRSRMPPQIITECITKVRDRYKHLYHLPVIEYLDGSRSFHNGILYRCQGLNLLFLKGDRVEMAFQHGRLLADQIGEGAVPQSTSLVANAVSNAVGKRGPLQSLITRSIRRFIMDPMLQFSLQKKQSVSGQMDALDEAIALSEGSGIPVMSFVEALLAPETIMILAGLGRRHFSNSSYVPKRIAAPLASCSSFAAWGSSTLDGRLLLGRNMDYPLNGYYDRFPTVVYHQPTTGELSYVSFTSAGVHTGGLTAYNAAGIFLASHVVPCQRASVRGVPAFSIANEVVLRAHTFDEAVELFRQFRPPSGWAYLLVSTAEQRAGTVEISNTHVAVRESDGDSFVQTNRFLTAPMRTQYLSINQSVDEDSDARFQRVQQLLKQEYGRLDVAGAMSILADQTDPTVNQVRGLGNTIGVHVTMTSVVLCPNQNRAFVAIGMAPVSHTEFVEIPLVGDLANPKSFPAQLQIVDNAAFTRSHPQIWNALQLFIRAKSAYEYENDVLGAYELLQKAVHCDPCNAAYFFQLGIFALKLGHFPEAAAAFDAVFSRSYATRQLCRLAQYYRGRAHAHLGQKSSALNDFSAVIADAQTNGQLRAASKRAMWRTKTFGRCRLRQRSLMIMMQQSDMLHY